METLTVNVVVLADALLVGTFAAVSILAAVRARQVGRAGGWVTAAFGGVTAALLGFTFPEHLGVDLPDWVGKALIVALLAFPYLLLRFSAAFEPLPRPLEAPALGVALGGALLTLALPVVPEPGAGDLPPWIFLYVALALAFWLVMSVLVVMRLWRAGRGQPTVARRRMRLMGVATAVLTVALLGSAPLGEEVGALGAFVRLAAIASGLVFGLGFRPPVAVRLRWRRPEAEALRAGRLAVLRATTVEEVTAALLPPTARIVTAGRVALVDADGAVVAAHGEEGVGTARRAVVPLPEGRGALEVWTSPYTPFFGPEELALLDEMATVAGLALERCALLAEERAQRDALAAARQEADRANRAKTEFLSRMSHELRTPLNAILGFGQVLEVSADLDPRDREAAGHIVKAGRHLLDLIDEVLSLSRIEAGTMTFSLEPVEVAELVTDAVDLVRPLAQARGITVEVSAAGCATHVRTDRQRARQVLLNVLSNAVKYNHDGGRVAVSCRPGEDGGVRVAVADTGPGIHPDRQAALFEPFERLGAERSEVEGTGLGLALSRQMLGQMDGEIGVDSQPGEGATFWIELPRADGPAVPAPAPDRPVPAGGRERSTLLLVEDNLSNQRVVEAMLRARPGITVLPAVQGRLALDLAYEHRPDVIVLDLHLPDMPGREVLARLRADPRTREIPVIVSSADASERRARQLRADGATAYVTKPLDRATFLAAVDAALPR